MPDNAVARLRSGVIGCGSIASTLADDIRDASLRMGLPYGHAPVLTENPRTMLVAAADNHDGRRTTFGERWGINDDHLYRDYRELLSTERLEIVSIATPSPLHAQMATAAIESGVKGIFLEKPVASSLRDAYRLAAACKSANVPVCVNHTRRGDQLYRKAKQIIERGDIGPLHSAVVHFSGNLMWNGTHAFDTLNFLNGDVPPDWMIGQLDDNAGLDPGGSAYVHFQNGLRAFINGSAGNTIPFRVEMIGADGVIVIGNHDLELWRRSTTGGFSELGRFPFPQVLPAVAPMAQLLEELIDAVLSGTPLVSDCDTATSALELIIGLHLSSNQGSCRVGLPPQDLDYSIMSN